MKLVTTFLLLILPFLTPAQEKIFYNAKIFTADREHPFAEAIAIKGKWIVAVGNYDDVKRSVGINAAQIDLGGSFLMPGFVDSHNHAIGGGTDLLKPNTGDKMMNVDELLAYAKKEGKAALAQSRDGAVHEHQQSKLFRSGITQPGRLAP